ncbi:MAG: cytochrome c oxidase subunit II [Tumebacillaceae bacterium]
MSKFFWLPDAVTQNAKNIDGLFGVIFVVALIVFILVEGMLVVFLLRYRRKRRDQQGLAIHGSTKAEVIWTVIPAIILVGLGIYSSGMVYSFQQPPADTYTIKVTGMKWSWSFEYPNGAKSYGDLRIPSDKKVLFEITSKDVIHSFWIPEMRIKQDAVPGRQTRFWIDPTVTVDPGQGKTYEKHIICAEYCGQNHSKMDADLTIMNGGDFDKWVAEQKVKPVVDANAVIQANGCASCHSVDGSPSVGPTWKGLADSDVVLANGQKVKADANYLKESITQPGAKVVQGFNNMMSPYDQLSPEALDNVVKYIQGLK